MPDRFTSGALNHNLDGTFTMEGVFDGIVFRFDFDSMDIDCFAWNDIHNRFKSPNSENLKDIKNLCNDFILDDDIELFQCLADIFDEILNDGFKFDNKAEIIIGGN